MENLNFYYSIIEKAIAKIGIDPQKTRTKNAGKWTLTKGEIPVWVDVVFVQNENRVYFQVASPVIKMTPENTARMSMDLLATNNGLYGVAFTSFKENVFIKTIREAEGLDATEAHAMIMRVGNYCEQYRKLLANKYPGQPSASRNNAPFVPNMI